MNNGPPPVDKTSLVEQLSQKPRASKVITDTPEHFKGTQLERFRVVVTPSRANAQSQLAAHVRLRDEIKLPLNEWETETGRAILGDLSAKEMLAHWIFSADEISPGKYQKYFGNSRDIEKALSGDEVAVLFALCQQVQFELGPRLQILTDAEVDAWIEKLKGGLDPLAYLQLPDLVELVRGLHRRLVRSTGSHHQDSQLSSSLDSGELSQESFATDTIFSGEQLDPLVDGLTTSDEITPEQAQAAARLFAGHSEPTD